MSAAEVFQVVDFTPLVKLPLDVCLVLYAGNSTRASPTSQDSDSGIPQIWYTVLNGMAQQEAQRRQRLVSAR